MSRLEESISAAVVGVDPQKKLGEKIRALREAKGWSQVELAKRSKLSRPTLRRYEAGLTARTDNLVELAEALGVRVFDLMTSDDEEGAKPVVVADSSTSGATVYGKQGREIQALVRELVELDEDDRRTVLAHFRGFLSGRKGSK